MHRDDEVRIRNRARLIEDPDLKLLLNEIDTLRYTVQQQDKKLEILQTSKTDHA